MGLIRSGAVVFFSGLLFLSLFLGNIFLTVSWSLEYEAIEPQLTKFASEMIEEISFDQLITESYPLMQLYCESQEVFTFSEQELNIEIPCPIINQGSQQVIEYGIQQPIKNIYYQEYECKFWECIKNTDTMFVLVSDKAREYWNSKFHLSIIVASVLFILLFIFIQSKRSVLTITGALMVVAAIPFRKINWILKLLPEGDFRELFSVFFTSAYNVFMTMIIIGIIIFLVGLAFEFFKIGLKLNNLFHWIFKRKDDKKGEIHLTENENQKTFTKEEVKKMVKKEIKKQKLKKDVKEVVKEELDKTNK